MHIKVNSPSEAVELAAKMVLANGDKSSPRGMDTLEIRNASIEILEPWRVPFVVKGRQLRSFIGAMEALQLVGQTTQPERMVAGVAKFSQFTDAGTFHGAYGPRIYGRLAEVVRQLGIDQDTRQAVLTIFDSRQDLGANHRDIPCTLSLQYFIRNGKLHARTSMRSNDVWLGLPYDLIQFIALQGAIAAAFNLPMGTYHHTVGSLHLYSQNADAVSELEATDIGPQVENLLWTSRFIEGEPVMRIGVISERARRILGGDMWDGMTNFEAWLWQAVEDVKWP